MKVAFGLKSEANKEVPGVSCGLLEDYEKKALDLDLGKLVL